MSNNCGLSTLLIILIFTLVSSLNIPLTRSRETCLVITQGFYEFEFVVSGNTEKEVRCVIQEQERVIAEVLGRSEYESEFEVKENEATICFSSLDNQPKSVSFDFMRTDDPLRGLIQDKQKMAVHQTLFNSYQQLEKLYRDQHFFLERNYIHEIILRNTEVVLIFFLLLKIAVIFIASCFQLYFAKRILDQNYQPLQQSDAQN